MTATAPRSPCVIDSLEPRHFLSVPASSPSYLAFSSPSAPSAASAAPMHASAASAAARARTQPLVFQRTIVHFPKIFGPYVEAAFGSNAFFTGIAHYPGRGNYAVTSSAVDILDLVTHRWSTARLSPGNHHYSSATLGSKAIFSAGEDVDIYDSSSHRWTHTKLPHQHPFPLIATVGTKAIFAGQFDPPIFKSAEVYDIPTRRWSTQALPLPCRGTFVATVRDKAIFDADGGVDIYDAATGRWSAAHFSPAPSYASAVVIGDLVVIVGGQIADTPSNIAHIYDARTGKWSTATGPSDHFFSAMAAAGTKAFFVHEASDPHQGYSLAVEVFDAITTRWSTHYLFADTRHTFISLIAALSDGPRIIIGSAFGPTDAHSAADVYDTQTNQWSRLALPADSSPDFASSIPAAALFTFRPHLSSASHSTSYDFDIYADPSPAPALTANADLHADQVALTIHNTGNAPLRAPAAVKIYASTQPSLKGAFLAGSATLENPIAPGSSAHINVPVSLFKGMFPKTYYLIAAVSAPNMKLTPIASLSTSTPLPPRATRIGHTI